MAFSIDIKLEKLPQSLQKGFANEIIEKFYKTAVNTLMIKLKNKMIKATPVATGLSRTSWKLKRAKIIDKFIEGQVRTSSFALLIVDEGRKPGGRKPPILPLRIWLRRKLNITDEAELFTASEGLQSKIARRGIKAKRTFTNTFEKFKPEIKQTMESATSKITKALSK